MPNKEDEAVFELGRQGQKYINENYEKLCVGLHKVFKDKKLCKKLDLVHWPTGRHKDRSVEALKTLVYVFNKLYPTYKKSTDNISICLFAQAIEKYITLFKLAFKACYYFSTGDIIKKVIHMLVRIRNLKICKCRKHPNIKTNTRTNTRPKNDQPPQVDNMSMESRKAYSSLMPLLNDVANKLENCNIVENNYTPCYCLKCSKFVNGPPDNQNSSLNIVCLECYKKELSNIIESLKS